MKRPTLTRDNRQKRTMPMSCSAASHQPPADAPVPLGQEDALDLVGDALMAAIEPLPGDQGGLTLIAAGLELLPCARCTSCYRAVLLEVRGEVDRLLAELGN